MIDYKGISRVDSGSTHGWFVRGYRNGVVYSKLFSDKKMGGKTASLDAAVKYRDYLLKELNTIPKVRSGRRLVLKDSRNKTGVLGVTRCEKKASDGKINAYYCVSWAPEPGVQKSTSFSVRKYGDKGALNRAIRFRKERMREIYGRGIFMKLRKQSIRKEREASSK